MNKRRRRSDTEWLDLIEQHERSDLSAIAFCQQQGLCSKTFYKHRRLLQLKSKQTTERFIKLDPHASSTVPLTAVLVYHNTRLELPAGVTVQWLAELMQAL